MAAEAVLLKSFRERIAAHMAGNGTLYPIKYIAYGDGGHNSNLQPISPQLFSMKSCARKLRLCARKTLCP
jgi:hypothetical protein